MCLLDLPCELRSLIYAFALSEDIEQTYLIYSRASWSGVLHANRLPAIWQVNRQIKDEAVGLFFSAACLEIRVWADDTSSPLDRLKRLQDAHPKAARYLLVNDNVNFRILYDTQSQDFDLFECLLTKYALRLDRPRWWFAAEHYRLPYNSRSQTVDLVRAREEQEHEFLMQDDQWQFEYETDAIGVLRPRLKQTMDTTWRMFLTFMERAEDSNKQ